MSNRGRSLGMSRTVYSAAKTVSIAFIEGSLRWEERTVKLSESHETEAAVCWIKDRDAGFTAQLLWEEGHVYLSGGSNSLEGSAGCRTMNEDSRTCLMRSSRGSCSLTSKYSTWIFGCFGKFYARGPFD